MLEPIEPRSDERQWSIMSAKQAARAGDPASAPARAENTAQVVQNGAGVGRRERVVMGPAGFKRRERTAQNVGAEHQRWFGKMAGVIGRLITRIQRRKG